MNASRVYRTETDEGICISVDGASWRVYKRDGELIRELSEVENVALNRELMLRSLPRGEDR